MKIEESEKWPISSSAIFMSLFWATNVYSDKDIKNISVDGSEDIDNLKIFLQMKDTKKYFEDMTKLSTNFLNKLKKLLKDPSSKLREIINSQKSKKQKLLSEYIIDKIEQNFEKMIEVIPQTSWSLQLFYANKLLDEIIDKSEKIKDLDQVIERKRKKAEKKQINRAESVIPTIKEITADSSKILNPYLLQLEKPSSAFFDFCNEVKSQYTSETNGILRIDLSKWAGEKWNALSEDAKTMRKDMYEAKKRSYEQAIKNAKDYETNIRNRILNKEKANLLNQTNEENKNKEQDISNYDLDSEQRLMRKKLKRRYEKNKDPLSVMELCDFVLFNRNTYKRRCYDSEESWVSDSSQYSENSDDSLATKLTADPSNEYDTAIVREQSIEKEMSQPIAIESEESCYSNSSESETEEGSE